MAECTQTPTRVRIPVEIRYSEMVHLYTVPAACWREKAVVIEIETDSYTTDQAPVALVVERRDPTYPMKEDLYRLVNGKLYCQAGPRCEPADACRAFVFDTEYRQSTVGPEERYFEPSRIRDLLPIADSDSVDYWIDHRELESQQRALEAKARELVLIDGALWCKAPEPCYQYDPDSGFEVNCGYCYDLDYHWNALEWEAAVRQLGSQGVDIDSGECEHIRVIIPEAVAMPTHGELCDMRCLAADLERIRDAEEILDKLSGGTLDASVLTESARASIQRSIESMAREVEVRRQRGTVKLTEEELQERTAAAVEELMRNGAVSRW